MDEASISRRALLLRSRDLGGLAAFSALGLTGTSDANVVAAAPAADVYRAIGVRPFINARGTFTILSGSLMLPEVRAAMDLAARQYVHLDELTEAIGARLATLTGAEWGLVTSGCAAALTHATAAASPAATPTSTSASRTSRASPETKSSSRSTRATSTTPPIRAVGVRVIEASTLAEFEAALGPRTAMVYVLAGPRAEAAPLTVEAMAPLTRPRGVPILVDAAAEILTIPNVHLQNRARRWSATAAASACAGRRRRACCSDRRTW